MGGSATRVVKNLKKSLGPEGFGRGLGGLPRRVLGSPTSAARNVGGKKIEKNF